jgi:deoxyribonuclease V
MHLRTLHPWNIPPKEAVAIQRGLASSIITDVPFDVDRARRIAGVDVSSTRFDPLLTAGVIVWDRETGDILEAVWAQRTQTMPYIPGLLSFREIPVLAEAIRHLTIEPDAFLVDGQGIAHPRRLGIAAHLGLLIDVPTVGIAKSLLAGKGDDPGNDAGSTTPLFDKGECIGAIVRTKAECKPLYISPGNRIGVDDAVSLALSCTRGYRLPEPTRLAHLHVNLARTTGKGLPISIPQTRLF